MTSAKAGPLKPARNSVLESSLYKQMIRIRNDELISEPRACVARACDFLGLSAERHYLDARASIVLKTPSKSRDRMQWDYGMIDAVRQRIDEFDFLHGYTYES